MDKTDRAILRELQDDFPLSENPYQVIAGRLHITTEKLWDRVRRMLDEGVIRRMGASIDSRGFGFAGTLAAARVRPEQIERASQIIGQFPEVTHSYLRKSVPPAGGDEFNIWFTLIAADEKKIEDILEHIRTALSLEKSDVLNLPMKRLFKLDARFNT